MAKKNKLSKNVSKNISNGTLLQTRDEYLHNEGDYRKPGYGNKGFYRKVVVIDSNRNDDLAVVKLRSEGEYLPVINGHYRPFVETLDNENKRIRVGSKFKVSRQRMGIDEVIKVKRDCFTNPRYRYKNKKKVRRIKGRR